jgi:hypothetical protein
MTPLKYKIVIKETPLIYLILISLIEQLFFSYIYYDLTKIKS